MFVVEIIHEGGPVIGRREKTLLETEDAYKKTFLSVVESSSEFITVVTTDNRRHAFKRALVTKIQCWSTDPDAN